MPKILMPIKRSKLPEEELKRREKEDKKLVEGMYFSSDVMDHEIEHDKYENYQTTWVLRHNQRQKIPNMIVKELKRCYYKENENIIDEKTGQPIKELANKKEYLHRFEPL